MEGNDIRATSDPANVAELDEKSTHCDSRFASSIRVSYYSVVIRKEKALVRGPRRVLLVCVRGTALECTSTRGSCLLVLVVQRVDDLALLSSRRIFE